METPSFPLTFVFLGAISLCAACDVPTLFVTRCNVLSDGAFRPALIVQNGGKRSVFNIGDAGVTRRIAQDNDAAAEWAKAHFSIPNASINECAGRSSGQDNPRPVAAPAPPPPPPPPPAVGTGGGCGPSYPV